MTMINGRDIPAVTAGQMREVDRMMVEDLHIELVQMMENAGRNVAELALRRFRPGTVTVLAGPGGNGGGAPCVRATATLTLALPKTGLAGASETGELFLADISVPPAVYARLGLTVPPLFHHDTIIELTPPPSPRA
jgi:NAD(P)H-hydrate repair Nnr-like enzyme with NAD(P)H-hydrate epimerase domain